MSRSSADRQTTVGVVLIGLYALLRLLMAGGESFSYDYVNYLTYFSTIHETDWDSIIEQVPVTGPYVVIPGGGIFEIGFVALSKLLLYVFSAPTAYAILGAVSIALRTFVMRRFGLGWGWVIATQAYAITLLEANALRAGLALTFTLCALLCLSRRQLLATAVMLLLAASQHLQSLLFAAPFVLIYLLPRRLVGRWWMVAGITLALAAGTLYALQLAGGIDAAKLDDYAGQTSEATGLNLISGLSMLFVAAALLKATFSRGERTQQELVWLVSLLASVPALVLVLAGELGAIGDRAWQFSLIVLAALSSSMASDATGRQLRAAALGVLLAVAMLNTLVRYPLSNFFSPPLPYEPIKPMWFAR